MELPFDKMAVNNLITNMKREKLSDDDIYDAMMELFPSLSCPVWWYEHVTEHDPTYDAARCSERSVRREADEAVRHAESEYDNKQQCLKHKHKIWHAKTLVTQLT